VRYLRSSEAVAEEGRLTTAAERLQRRPRSSPHLPSSCAGLFIEEDLGLKGIAATTIPSRWWRELNRRYEPLGIVQNVHLHLGHRSSAAPRTRALADELIEEPV